MTFDIKRGKALVFDGYPESNKLFRQNIDRYMAIASPGEQPAEQAELEAWHPSETTEDVSSELLLNPLLDAETQIIEPEEFYEIEDSPDPRIDKIRATAEKVVFGGLAKAVSAARLARRGVSRTIDKTSELHTKASASTMNALLSPEHKTKRRIVLALGAIAVAALAYKGLMPTSHHRLHEAQQAVPNRTSAHPAEALHFKPSTPILTENIKPVSTSQLHDFLDQNSSHHSAVSETVRHAKTVKEAAKHVQPRHLPPGVVIPPVTIKPGEGYTQVEAQLFPGRTAAQYYAGYKEAVRHLGPNFVRGVAHFKLSNGDYGLEKGKAHVTQVAYRLLSGYFKASS